MAEVTKKKSARVERRGRFTITEIEPDSPASSANGEPHSYDHIDDDGGDQHGLENGNGDDDDAGDGNGRQSFVRDSAAAAALMATERISPFGSAVFERSNGAVRVVGSSDANGENTDSITSGMAVTETGVGDGDAALEHGDRRVKRKGRFTIIELSSDSPRSRRDSAEEFSTTTSISVTSAQVSQANAQNLSCSPTMSGSFASSNGAGSESRGRSAVFSRASSESTPTNSGRMSRSMVAAAGENNESRGRSGHYRRPSTSRMRSVSPVRGLHDQISNQNGHDASHPHSASCGSAPFRPQSYSKSPQLRAMHPSPAMNGMAAPSSSVLAAGGATVTEKQHAPLELGSNRRHLASRQKAITISAEQFIQQQQTIASLIRQQQDLKQLIGVLQDQQHHLMSIPLPLNEFKLDQAHSNAQEDSMREVQIQVSTLSRANDALQTLLSQAEHDAHERTMEIECLSDENDEIRHRFSMMEQRYHDERKRSLTLEQELQRTRRALYSARQRNEKSDYNLQKQQYKLSSRTVSRRLEDPIEPEPPVQKTV